MNKIQNFLAVMFQSIKHALVKTDKHELTTILPFHDIMHVIRGRCRLILDEDDYNLVIIVLDCLTNQLGVEQFGPESEQGQFYLKTECYPYESVLFSTEEQYISFMQEVTSKVEMHFYTDTGPELGLYEPFLNVNWASEDEALENWESEDEALENGEELQ